MALHEHNKETEKSNIKSNTDALFHVPATNLLITVEPSGAAAVTINQKNSILTFTC
jgi:hypothetical protein